VINQIIILQEEKGEKQEKEQQQLYNKYNKYYIIRQYLTASILNTKHTTVKKSSYLKV